MSDENKPSGLELEIWRAEIERRRWWKYYLLALRQLSILIGAVGAAILVIADITWRVLEWLKK